MSIVLKCNFLGEEAVFGCGFSAAAAEVEKQLEFEELPKSHPVLSKCQTARSKSVQSPAVRSERFYSCEEDSTFDEVLRQSNFVASTHDGSEDSTDLLDESTAYAEEATSVASGEAAPRSATTEEARQVEELRRRVSDMLGPLHVHTLGDANARGTVELLGGHPTCFWRFLRSCNWDADAAERKLRKTFEFRAAIGANSFLENPAAVEVHDKLKDVWPEVPLGCSSDGSPVSYFDLGKAVHFLSLGYDEETIRTYWLSWMERSNALQREGRSRASGRISSLDMPGTVVVYNLEGLALSQLTSCLSGLHCFTRVLSLAEQHYPSNLRKAVIMNAPSVFSKMVWPLVQKALDAETLSNVLVCDGSDYESLSAEELGFSPSELTELLKRI